MKMSIPSSLFQTWLFITPELYNRIIKCMGQFDKRSYFIFRRFLDIVHTERGFFTENGDNLDFNWEWDMFTAECFKQVGKDEHEPNEISGLEIEYGRRLEIDQNVKVPIIFSLLRLTNKDIVQSAEEEPEEGILNLDELRDYILEDMPVFTISLSNQPCELVTALEFAVSMMDKYNVLIRYSKMENPVDNLEILAFPKIL